MARFVAPVADRITQQFGENPDYYRSLGQLGHTGIDYGCSMGTSVRATGDGRVSFAGSGANHGGFLAVAGNAILLDHGDIYSAYSHVSRFAVSQGQQVSQGQVIGYSGNTGQVTGPHLHFEFWGKPTNWQNGWSGRVNPNNYLSAAGAAGDEPMIADTDNEYARWNKLFIQIRGRGASREEFRAAAVGRNWLNAMEILSDDAEAEQATQDQATGRVARIDNWPGQIYGLIDQVNELAKRPTSEKLTELTGKLEVLTQSADSAKAERDAVVETNKRLEEAQRIDKEAGESLLRRLGQFVSKYIPRLK